eukprot:TRINITY_DN46_c0_g1_i3.p1 TRINITY_DN46_c0_g1~~TRINITY_DN46_c0_g1_i3.p1  ORF type:complete len:111 (-),score=14.47 TRINITY_DN46_c0_g1_i3:572-904(-)
MAKVFETKIMTGELINNDIFNDEVVLKITNISGKTICIANRDLSPVNFQVHCVKEYHSGSEEDEVTDIDFAEVSYKLKIPLRSPELSIKKGSYFEIDHLEEHEISLNFIE